MPFMAQSVHNLHHLSLVSEVASRLRPRTTFQWRTQPVTRFNSGAEMNTAGHLAEHTQTFAEQVVALIQMDLPGVEISRNPTMPDLARYGRLSGVDPSAWLVSRV
jgi:hypothetical protein